MHKETPPLVLVADDTDMVRYAITMALRGAGFDVVGTSDGVEGLSLARKHRPELMMVDIHMAPADGYDFLDQVRRDRSLADTPFVLMTGGGHVEEARKAMISGADDVLFKPFHNADLVATVSACLDKHRLIQAQAKERLDEIEHSLGAVLPHELRTPLIGIMGFSHLLRESYDSLPREEIGDFAREIYTSAARLRRLVENFQVYFKNHQLLHNRDSHRQLFEGQDLDVSEVLRTVVDLKAEEYGRSSDVSLSSCSIRFSIAENVFVKLVEELLDNALKFSNAGSKISVEAHVEQTSFLLEVVDHGRGISPEMWNRVSAYRQFDRDRHEQQGVGLGLAIVRQIVTILGGEVNAGITPGGGATIRVQIPNELGVSGETGLAAQVERCRQQSRGNDDEHRCEDRVLELNLEPR